MQRNNVEKIRETKWQSMMKDWSKHYSASKGKYSEKLTSRVFKGIPNSMRNLAWFKILDVDNQIRAHAGLYEVCTGLLECHKSS